MIVEGFWVLLHDLWYIAAAIIVAAVAVGGVVAYV